MSLEAKLKIKGLYDNPNPYSAAPQGALQDADNIVIDREDIASPRRGFSYHSDAGTNNYINSFTEYQGNIIAHVGANGLQYYKETATVGWQVYSGTYAAITGARMRFIQESGNLYFNTSLGLKKLTAFSGSVEAAGVPKAISVTGSLTTGSFLLTDNQVAYRVVWGIKDANGNLHLGAPSERLVITNPSGGSAYGVSLTVYIPAGITTSHFFQVYRSALSSADHIPPTDDLYLVYEASPSSTNISTDHCVTFTDNTPTDLTGATLYTSPSQEGLLSGNDQPPLAADIAVFKGYTFFADTETRHSHYLTLLGVGSPNGLQNNDTVAIGGVTYTAKTTLTAPAVDTEFLISASGSAAKAIEETAQALVKAINTAASNTIVYSYYLSSSEDLPGKIRIEARSLGASNSFTTTVSRASAWSQVGTASTNDDWANGLYYSKEKQPEAVPLVNYIRIGSANNAILRIMALRDSLFIFKDQEGVYRLYGDNPGNFQVDLFDSSARLLAKETLAVLNNAVYGLFDQGVCRVAETGVTTLSRPIEKRLLELQGAILADIKTYAWAMSYESDRRYILHLPSVEADNKTTQALTYNSFTSAWTRWVVTHRAGFVRPSTNVMYVGAADSTRMLKERKDYTFSDIADEAIAVTVESVASDGYSVVLADVTNVSEGDLLYQDSTTFAQVDTVDVITRVVTLKQNTGFSVSGGAVTHEIRQAYTCTVTWQPFSGDDPMIAKQFREASLIFSRSYNDCVVRFCNNPLSVGTNIPASGTVLGLWGLFPWGEIPWGGDTPNKVLRVYVPRNNQRSGQLSVTFEQTAAYNQFELCGLHLVYNVIGEKITR